MGRDAPAIYDLEPSEGGKTIIIRTPESVAEYISSILKPELDFLKHFTTKFQIPDFISPSHLEWGFGNVFKTEYTDDDEVAWICELPGNTQKGDGYEPTRAVSATLSVLFSVYGLAYEDAENNSAKKQLMGVDLVTDYGLHGGSIEVALADAIVPWLSSFPDNHNHEGIGETMRAARVHMLREDTFGLMRFMAWFRDPKWVNLGVPGSACGLDPKDYYVGDPKQGYKLLPHNVDGPIQQLTLLMGVAQMYKEAREVGL